MSNSHQHIVSSVKWSSQFDRADMAIQLQNRISHWSKFKLPGQLHDVFNKLCPSDQIWRINNLQLDLGPIDFNEMESQLEDKLGILLYQKLTELVLQQNNINDSLEVIHQNESYIHMMQTFFLTGVLPWNYTNELGSINEITTQQLQANFSTTIIALKEVGVTHENVRKRMAWQLHETNLKKIIQGIEPNNHKTILGFSAELTTLQQKETIVQTSNAEFKKQVYFWILNHLLTERGTLFNKIAFVKSSIAQMARHYNIEYVELIQLINRAVSHYEAKGTHANFITILKEISNTDTIEGDKINSEPRDNNDNHKKLELLIAHGSTKLENKTQTEFKKLIEKYSNDDILELKILLKKYPSVLLQDPGTLHQLGTKTLTLMLKSLLEKDFAGYEKKISELHSLIKQTKFRFSKKEILQVAVLIALENNTNASKGHDVQAILTKLAQLNRIAVKQLLDELIAVDYTQDKLTSSNIITINKIRNLWIKHASPENTHTFTKLEEVITQLKNEIESAVQNTSHIYKLLSVISNTFFTVPHFTIEMLRKIQDKTLLEFILDHTLTSSLVKQSVKRSKVPVLIVLNNLLHEVENNKESPLILTHKVTFEKELSVQGFKLYLLNPQFTVTQFKAILSQQMKQVFKNNGAAVEKFILGEEIKPGLQNANTYKLSHTPTELVLDHIAAMFMPDAKKTFKAHQYTKSEAGRILLHSYNHHAFKNSREKRNHSTHNLIEYFLLNGTNLQQQLINHYLKQLKNEIKTISSATLSRILGDLFWKCLLDFSYHQGKVETFKKFFHVAVLQRFPQTAKNKSSNYVYLDQSSAKKTVYLNHVTDEELMTWLQACIKPSNAFEPVSITKFSLNELITNTLKYRKNVLIKILHEADTKELEKILASNFTVQEFLHLFKENLPPETGDHLSVLLFIPQLAAILEENSIKKEIHELLFAEAIRVIKTNALSSQQLDELVKKVFALILTRTNVNLEDVLKDIRLNKPPMNNKLYQSLERVLPAVANIYTGELINVKNSSITRYKNTGQLKELCAFIITQNQVPPWHLETPSDNKQLLLSGIAQFHPLILIETIRNSSFTITHLHNTLDSLTVDQIIKAIKSIHPELNNKLTHFNQFYASWDQIHGFGISSTTLQHILGMKLLKAWKSKNWKSISITNIWNELAWELSINHRTSQHSFFQHIKKNLHVFSPAVQLSFTSTYNRYQESSKFTNTVYQKKLPSTPLIKENKKATGIEIKNAGIVLLNSYIPILFERLGLTKQQQFINETNQHDAVHYLQFVVTGLFNTEEHLLLLNKVLCGLPLNHPISNGIELTESQRNLITGLIKAAIGYWPSAGDTSINGFRGNWLVRNGLLFEYEDKWELHIEKKVYDILISKSPFSFSIIKFPWMKKPLHVTWPY